MAFKATNCIISLRCGLPGAVKNARAGLIQSYMAAIDVEIAALEGKLIYLNILTTPVSLLGTLAQEALNQARAGANIIPFDLMKECDVGLNPLVVGIQANVDLL